MRKGRTRAERQDQPCSEKLRSVDENIARAGGIAVNTWLCVPSLATSPEEIKMLCPSSWGHSPRIAPQRIPTRLFAVFDAAGKENTQYDNIYIHINNNLEST